MAGSCFAYLFIFFRGVSRVAKMLYAFEVSLKNAPWLDSKKTPGAEVYRAPVELARHYCQQIDEAERMADPVHLQKTMAVCGPNLQKTLTSLGLTPQEQGAIKPAEQAKETKLDELKRKRELRASAG